MGCEKRDTPDGSREGGAGQQVLALDDPGLLLDADRPDDYHRLLQCAKERGIQLPLGSSDSDPEQERST